ncbi:hydroxyisourate hydrolase [Paenibacillus sinopodophylli]|uniref:hydroxyisourate hydrolase n=1 Tax=Paenibacillus sinopodophylli TaxID=1837342 RepID=UPI00110CD5C4|nr:hydroxyisourate hydrolase [Paenibacillus sinopodophylli]
MSGRITTHVLDLACGKPVVGIAIELWYLGLGTSGDTNNKELPELIGCYQTNADGRVDQPLLEGDAVKEGMYELLFAAGDYFRRTAQLSTIQDYLFDHIPIRFRIQNVHTHYHIPLLVAPGGYSTYRGS